MASSFTSFAGKAGATAGVLALNLALGSAHFWLGWRVSGDFQEEMILSFDQTVFGPVRAFPTGHYQSPRKPTSDEERKEQLTELRAAYGKTVRKDRLGILDALLNSISAFSVLCSLVLLAFLCLVFCVFALVGGIVTANWELVVGAIILPVAGVLCLFLLIFAAVFFYFAMLFQPCTPGYVLLWLILGLIAIGGGGTSNFFVLRAVHVIWFPRVGLGVAATFGPR